MLRFVRVLSRPCPQLLAFRGFSVDSTEGVKKLRTATGAPISECKKALVDANGDIEAAIVGLRKKGISVAASKMGRPASCGLVAVGVADKIATIVEVNSETDFVERNNLFQDMVANISRAYLSIAQHGKITLDDLKAAKMTTETSSDSVSEQLMQLVGVIRENLQLRRCDSLSVNNGLVATYVHSCVKPNIGKIGVLVALETTSSEKEKLEEIGNSIAMHIASAKPRFLKTADVPKEAIEKEEAIFREQIATTGKTGKIAEQMLAGKMASFYKDVVLMNQVHVLDEGKRSVENFVKDASKTLGAPVELKGYVLFQVGS